MQIQQTIELEQSKTAKRRLMRKLHSLLTELQDERAKGRDIESLGKRPLPVYFNTGCCLYKSGITTIEIEGDRIELVKWSQSRSPKREWTVPGQLREFIKALG